MLPLSALNSVTLKCSCVLSNLVILRSKKPIHRLLVPHDLGEGPSEGFVIPVKQRDTASLLLLIKHVYCFLNEGSA